MGKKEKEREKEVERERQKHEEYVELLKMKQGLIDESELIPQTGYDEIPELHGFAKVKNYIYHMKWIMLFFAAIIAIVIFLVVQVVTRENEDLMVLVISTRNDSELGWRLDDIRKAFEKYTPDFDGNGKVVVTTALIDLSYETGVNEYTNAQVAKFSSEMMAGNSQLFLADEGLWTQLYEKDQYEYDLFIDYSEELPADVLYKNVGIRVNSTDFAKEARWHTCPDFIDFYMRCEYENMPGNDKTAKEQRERAEIVMRNILDGNIVNPDVSSD